MKVRYIIIAGVVVIVSVSLWLLLTRQEKPEAVARSVAECIADVDAKCLLDRTPEDEKKAYELTEKKLEELLREYVLPSFQHLSMDNQGIKGGDTKEAIFAVSYGESNGFEIGYAVIATATDSGVKCPGLVTGLLMSSFGARHKVIPSGSKFVDKMQLWINAAELDRAKLDALGIRGVYRSQKEGLLNWNQWIEHCNEGIRRNKSRRVARLFRVTSFSIESRVPLLSREQKSLPPLILARDSSAV